MTEISYEYQAGYRDGWIAALKAATATAEKAANDTRDLAVLAVPESRKATELLAQMKNLLRDGVSMA